MIKALFINGSPRKNWNTDKVLKEAERAASEKGFETENICLYDYEYKGCISCFACKVKNSRTNGLCAYKDALHPVLEKAHEADMVVVGSPVYYSYPTGQVRSFIERWLFPVGSYMWDNGVQKVFREKVITTGLIYTMNCPEEAMDEWGYPLILSDTARSMKAIMGHNELLYVCNTYQFKDYSRYDINLFNEEDKRKYRDEHFETDLKNAYDMGKRIAEEALRIAGE